MTYTNTLKQAQEFIESIEEVINIMINIDTEVGDIWLWPDAKSCYRYAITESAEFLEAYLLANRPNDSRNNKTADDFDAATELFDTSMMLLRGVLRSYRWIDVREARDLFMKSLSENVSSNFIRLDYSKIGKRYTECPEELVLEVAKIASAASETSITDSMLHQLLFSIYLSNTFSDTSYVEVARKKLEKIRVKNLAKKEQNVIA